MLFRAAQNIQLLADGLPGINPSDRLRFSRLQLRGSAGIAPASLSSPRGEDAQTEGHFKERKYWLKEFSGGGLGSQMRFTTKGTKGHKGNTRNSIQEILRFPLC
jgi:hypothetical protein